MMQWIHLTILIVLFCLCFNTSNAGICHQKEISDVHSSLQYELQMIEIERKRCLQSINTSLASSTSLCNQVFDGMMCWPPAIAGTVSVQRCPNYMTTHLPDRNASKICLPNGNWYVHPVFNKTWTNLSACYDQNTNYGPFVPAVIKDHVKKIKNLYDIGYSISLVSLVIAVSIMIYFRNLRCQRNTIHVNMFVSFIFRSVICFMKDAYLIPEVDSKYSQSSTNNGLTTGQSTGCKIVYTLFYYILSTNCMWIFVEGIYMHSFVQSTKYNVSIKLYKTLLVFGWGFPSMFVFPWVLVRMSFENTLCWNIHDVDNGYIWMIKGPITVTVVINFVFFINIIRVLYTKLTAANKKNPKRYRKLAKSTLTLIPLFGVYHMAFIAVPSCMNPVLEVVWMYTEMFFNSFQGFAVSVLFCYMNEEVKREIMKVQRKRTLRRRNSRISNKSVSKSGEHELRIHESPSGNFHIELTESNCKDHGNEIEHQIELTETKVHNQKEFTNGNCNGNSQLGKAEKSKGRHAKISSVKFSNSCVCFEEESVHMLDT